MLHAAYERLPCCRVSEARLIERRRCYHYPSLHRGWGRSDTPSISAGLSRDRGVAVLTRQDWEQRGER